MSTAAGWYPDPSGAGGQRYWDGMAWSDVSVPYAQRLSPDTRADILNQTIMAERARNPMLKVESHTPHQAVLSYGDTNHVLHAILALLTCGFWLIVWLFMLTPTVRRVVTVDQYGEVSWV